MTETNPITEKTAKVCFTLGKLESIIFKGSDSQNEIKLSVYRIKTVFDALIAMQHSTLNKTDIVDAHSALDELQHLALKNAKQDSEEYEVKVYIENIRIALPPKPMPTIADIEWDEEKHFLAEAEHPDYGNVIMIDEVQHEHILVIESHDNLIKATYVLSEDLTPTGRRYTLTD